MPRAIVALALGLLLLPTPGSAQLVIRNDSDGWGWLTMVPNRRAVVLLQFANPVTGVQGHLNDQILAELGAKGVGRIFDSSSFEAAQNQVIVECTATDRAVGESATDVDFAVHAEVAYWDQARLAATEIYESILLGAVPRDQFRPDAYVQACSTQVADVLKKLGFTQG